MQHSATYTVWATQIKAARYTANPSIKHTGYWQYRTLNCDLGSSTSPPSTLSDNSGTSTQSVAALHPPRNNLVPPSDSGATSSELGIAVRLPKLTIPTFGGDPLDWQPFWDSFEATHNNSQLNGEKLRAQLRGDAAQVIAGLPLTYQKHWWYN